MLLADVLKETMAIRAQLLLQGAQGGWYQDPGVLEPGLWGWRCKERPAINHWGTEAESNNVSPASCTELLIRTRTPTKRPG
jgi:hypothetical protein